MAYSELAKNAYHHLTKLGPKKLSEFIESIGPIDIPVRYGDDLLLGLSRIVVGQQLSNQAARSIWERLVTQYPQRSKLIDALKNSETPNTGLSASKKRTLSDLTHRGDHWIQTIATQSEPKRREVLLEIWGLGPWSVAMWELFVLRNPNQWSDKDLILRRLSIVFASELGEDAAEFVERASPFRSYLALYCWRFNDQNRH